MVGLYGKVENFDAFVVGYFVEDGPGTSGNLVNEYRLAVLSGARLRDVRRTIGSARLRQLHYVVVEVVGRVPCGLHPYCTL